MTHPPLHTACSGHSSYSRAGRVPVCAQASGWPARGRRRKVWNTLCPFVPFGRMGLHAQSCLQRGRARPSAITPFLTTKGASHA
ncbi:MAG: hypothetical protein Q4F13_03150 [Pseudomonadota bacterium]|nr:hypothetical protein [Pseudomonadota bacterium]